jgi:hypothetical protein
METVQGFILKNDIIWYQIFHVVPSVSSQNPLRSFALWSPTKTCKICRCWHSPCAESRPPQFISHQNLHESIKHLHELRAVKNVKPDGTDIRNIGWVSTKFYSLCREHWFQDEKESPLFHNFFVHHPNILRMLMPRSIEILVPRVRIGQNATSSFDIM